MAEWLGTGLQNRLQQFESARNLKYKRNRKATLFLFRVEMIRMFNLKWLVSTLLFVAPAFSFANGAESEMEYLEEVEVVTDVKRSKPVEELPVSANSFNMTKLESSGLSSSKDVAVFVPNFHLPDYGSQMTSSIYVRGFGARIEQPVVGMLVDNVPVLNKNGFDMDLFDVQRMEFLRGPQGTLYGRNTMCGLINLFTLNPFSYQGTRLFVEGAKGQELKLKASTYHKISDKFAFSMAANAQHRKGLFRNVYDDSWCDPSNGLTLRSRQMWRPKTRLSLENSVTFGLLKQGGYAYGLVTDEGRRPVNYNDECRYNRVTLSDGFVLKYEMERLDISSITSYQWLKDDMLLDQDFQPQPIFTLNQRQNEHAFTEEIVFQSKRKEKVWNWKSGASGFYKHNDMKAPVVFKRGGIDQLILQNANAGIQSVFPTERLDISEEEFPIFSEFVLPTFGLAAYHQSEFKVGGWTFAAGIRVDYEHVRMDYRNGADIHYIFTYLMKDYKLLQSRMEGKAEKSFFELLPKISVQYDFDRKNNLYAYAAKGYKAGGFNTQIFSDLLQTQLKGDIMADMGMKFDGMNDTPYDTEEATSYDPEYSWTYEMGGHFSYAKNHLNTNFSLFYIDCRDQQLTVFPAGKSTGRMMTNAGKSRSIGGEFSTTFTYENFSLTGTYGYTNAKFVDFYDGINRYDGNFVTYSPMHTASLWAQYIFCVNRRVLDKVILAADWRGTGRIYWDEANTVSQPFYSLFDAYVTFQKKNFQLKGWCRNIGDTLYDTFYFVSVGNRFCQAGRPRQIGVGLSYEF